MFGLMAAATLLFGMLFGGSRYFFCPAMDRVHGSDPCCAHFEASIADRAQASRDAEHAAIGEDERCCEARHFVTLPGGVAAAEAPAFEAPWVGLVASPPSAFMVSVSSAPDFGPEARASTGPPPRSAPLMCARLSVFLI